MFLRFFSRYYTCLNQHAFYCVCWCVWPLQCVWTLSSFPKETVHFRKHGFVNLFCTQLIFHNNHTFFFIGVLCPTTATTVFSHSTSTLSNKLVLFSYTVVNIINNISEIVLPAYESECSVRMVSKSIRHAHSCTCHNDDASLITRSVSTECTGHVRGNCTTKLLATIVFYRKLSLRTASLWVL